MGIGKFMKRADEAVQDTKSTVNTVAVLAGLALVVAALALVIAVRRTA